MKKRASSARPDSEALWEWNLEANRIHFSPRWISLVGCEEHEVGNTPEEWLDRVHPEELPEVLRHIELARGDDADEFDVKHRLRHKDGRYRWTTCRVSVARDRGGSNVRLIGAHSDITVETVTDKLTGLPNRLLLLDRLTHSIERAQKYEGFHYAVLLIQLGRTGDPVLTAAARRLETSLRIANATPSLRSNDFVARMEGDQFAVLLDGLKAVSHAMVVSERLLKETLAPFTINGREVFLSASIGVAVSATGYTRADDVLHDAETALHRAQVLGGSHCEVFDTAILQSHQTELQLEGDLKDALERREFRLLYQPIVAIATNEIIGFEALVRWHHPGLGIVSPADFIPIAERTELIVPLGEWILREACTRLKAWQDSPGLSNELWISVNLSGVQLKDATLVQRVGEALHDSGLAPRTLVLELTESMAMENPTGVKSLLMELRASGVRISIDDFGTGYSSLAHLRELPVDALKIDRSFVRGIESRKDTADIIGTLIEMALQLGLHVVAEGIENETQLALLRGLRCHAAQGYLFARPLDEAKATELLNTRLPPRRTLANDTNPTTRLAAVGKWAWAATALAAIVAVSILSSPPVVIGRAPAPETQPTPAVAPSVVETPAPVQTPPPAAANPPGARVEPAAKPKTPMPPATVAVTTKNAAARAADEHAPSAATGTNEAPSVAPASAAVPQPESPPPTATSLSIHVMHYHRVGHCEGRLVVSRAGIAYVPDSKTSRDSFDFQHNEFVHILQDDTLTIKSSTKTYRFKQIVDKDEKQPSLDEFNTRLTRWR